MRRTLILAIVLLAAALPLAAQSLTGTVAGTIKDAQGGVLPGVSVTLAGKAGSRSVVTDAEGGYRFAAVDPGTYTLTAELQGFRPRRQDSLIVSIGRVSEVNVALAVGGVTENVEVIGESPVIDASSSATDNALSQDMLFNMPIRPDNAATGLLNYLPGINNGSALGGNEDYGNALLVDGVDTRDPDAGSAWTFFNFNIVDEVQVGGIGAPAEYGAYTGAVVNTLTKSGGNRVAGLFDAYYTRKSFYSDNLSKDVISKNPALTDPAYYRKRLDLSGQISGPIVKDKLFFFVSAQRFELNENPTGPNTQRTEVSPRFNTKLTWQAGPNDNLSASLQWDYYNVTGRNTISSGLNTDAMTVNQDSPEAIWGLQWRHLFGTNTFAEVKYTGWWGYYYLDPKLKVPMSYDLATDGFSGGALNYYYADRNRQQLNASVSHFAEAFGKHDLKFGVEIERSKIHSRYGYNQGLYYYDDTSNYEKGQYYAFAYSYDSEGRNQRESLYAQDSWKPSERLTINAGVRVDFVRGKSPLLDKTLYDNVNWAPRLGFAFDLTGDSKTVLKGHYGQYYDGIYFFNYQKAAPGFQPYQTLLYDSSGDICGPAGNCFSVDSELPAPIHNVDPNMKHPRVDEWTAGLERALTKDIRFEVTGIYRQDKNMQGTVYPDATWTPNTVTNGLTGQPLTVYKWANRSASENNVLYTNPDGFQYKAPDGSVVGTARAERKYKALMVVLDKRFTNRWQGRISYVLSKAEGTIDNTGAPTYGARTFWQTPTTAIVNTFGNATNDRTHEVKVFGSWIVPKLELNISGYYSYLTGRNYSPYQRFGSRDITYPTAGGRQPFLEGRGSRRLPNEHNLDLRLEKIFELSGGNRIAAYADIQNVFNSGVVIGVNARYPQASTSLDGETVTIDFGAPTAVASPRRFILGARWSF